VNKFNSKWRPLCAVLIGTLIRDANVYGYPTPRQFLYFSLIGPVWIGTVRT